MDGFTDKKYHLFYPNFFLIDVLHFGLLLDRI